MRCSKFTFAKCRQNVDVCRNWIFKQKCLPFLSKSAREEGTQTIFLCFNYSNATSDFVAAWWLEKSSSSSLSWLHCSTLNYFVNIQNSALGLQYQLRKFPTRNIFAVSHAESLKILKQRHRYWMESSTHQILLNNFFLLLVNLFQWFFSKVRIVWKKSREGK